MVKVETSKDKWRVFTANVKETQVIFRVLDEIPPKSIKDKFNWLTVISWKYDGTQNNGMPIASVNKEMLQLEDVLDEIQDSYNLCVHTNSRIGNNLKEFVYYIHNREEFMAAFNQALVGHPRYPIEIKFFQDGEWTDLKKLLSSFNKQA